MIRKLNPPWKWTSSQLHQNVTRLFLRFIFTQIDLERADIDRDPDQVAVVYPPDLLISTKSCVVNFEMILMNVERRIWSREKLALEHLHLSGPGREEPGLQLST